MKYSLADTVDRTTKLEFKQRLSVALGAARGKTSENSKECLAEEV